MSRRTRPTPASSPSYEEPETRPGERMSAYCVPDIELDGGIFGDPTGYRFATGRRNLNVKGIGNDMLQGKHHDYESVENDESER
jgi:hypothetical protein